MAEPGAATHRSPFPIERFEVGAHALAIARLGKAEFQVAVDGEPLKEVFETSAAAWAAGVRLAYALDERRAAEPMAFDAQPSP